MASGALDFNMSQSSGSYLLGRLEWHSTANVGANQSNVTADIYVKKGSTYTTLNQYTTGTWTYTINIDTQSFSGSIHASVRTEYIFLGSATLNNIPHFADGSRYIAISGSVSGPAGTSFAGHTTSGGGAATLDNIPRASSVSAPAWGTIGSACNISIYRASSDFYHTLTYSFAGASGTIAQNTWDTNVSWTPPMSLCNQIPNAESASCTITCTTYSGSSQVGDSASCTMNLSVPSNVGLSCGGGWAAVSHYNTGTAAENINAYVKGYSKAEVQFDASKISTQNSYGASIASFKAVFNGAAYTAAPYRTAVITSPGAASITCYVYDTRGRSVQTTLSFTVEDYAAPTLSGIAAYRCDSSGAADNSGTYIYAKAAATYSSVGGLNAAVLKARYKAASGSYGGYTELVSNTPAILGGGAISITASYTVEITLTDSLGNSVSYTSYVPTASVAFNLRAGGNGAAFGEYAEEDNVLKIPYTWALKIGNTAVNETQLQELLKLI